MAVISHPPFRAYDDAPDIQPLTVSAAADLRLPILSRITQAGLVARVHDQPGLAFVAEGTCNIALGSFWRRRPDIGEIVEVSRGPQSRALLHRLLGAFDERGVSLVLLDYDESSYEAQFYESEGFGRMDRIVEFFLPSPRLEHWVADPDVSPYEPSLRDEVLEIERESFPWMWRNSLDEMIAYESTRGVEMYVLKDRGRFAGYAGITVNDVTVHLDRLAVRRACQNRGLGGRLVAFVIKRAEALRARRLTLSTQHDNFRSQALYQRFGFRRGRWSYDIRGLWLQQPGEARP